MFGILTVLVFVVVRGVSLALFSNLNGEVLQLTEIITKEKYLKMGPKHEDNKYLMYS